MNNQPPPLPANLPRNTRQAFPDPHLKASDLPAAGATYKIRLVEWRMLRPKNEYEPKPVIWFTTPKGATCSKYLIMNKTQAEAIAQILDSENWDDWTSHLIHLSPASAKGKDTIAVSPAPLDLVQKYAAKPEAIQPAPATETPEALAQRKADKAALYGDEKDPF